jgi:hypothetical protein
LGEESLLIGWVRLDAHWLAALLSGGFTVDRGMKTPSEDYKAAQTLAFGLVDFAKRISGGQADFAAGLASTRATGPQSWFKTANDY